MIRRDHTKTIPEWIRVKTEKVGKGDLTAFIVKVPPQKSKSWVRRIQRYLILNKEKGLKPTSTTISVKLVPGSDSLICVQNSGLVGRWYPKDSVSFITKALAEIEAVHREDWAPKGQIRKLLLAEPPDLWEAYKIANEEVLEEHMDITTSEKASDELLNKMYKTPRSVKGQELLHLLIEEEYDRLSSVLENDSIKLKAFTKLAETADKLSVKELKRRFSGLLSIDKNKKE